MMSGTSLNVEQEKKAMGLYAKLATEIAPYHKLTGQTHAFNELVRSAYGLALSDAEYVSLRLDAQHIVEAAWFAPFRRQFFAAFGWKSDKEMDAIALHTEWHIRSGAKLSANLGLRGAERFVSLTKALQDALLQGRQTIQRQRLFPSLDALFAAHEVFYRQYSPRLWTKLERWFQERRAHIQRRGL